VEQISVKLMSWPIVALSFAILQPTVLEAQDNQADPIESVTPDSSAVVGPNASSGNGTAVRSAARPSLAAPTRDPLALEFTDDPIVQYVRTTIANEEFARLVADAVMAAPAVDEARATLLEAEAARREARSGLFPTIDVSFGTRASFARNFSNDPDNVLERARSTGRTDAIATLSQRVIDFGATSIRIDAAGARLRASSQEINRQADRAALRAIGSWYDVFTQRTLVALAEDFVDRNLELRAAVVQRVGEGLSAEGDLARMDSLVATSQANLARYRRNLATSEAIFVELFNRYPPADLVRAPTPPQTFVSLDSVRNAAINSAAVEIGEAQARAARQDARAARSDTLPTLNAGIEAGRFGVFETDNDYDVRGTLTLQHRFFGGADARADQSEARADAAQARSEGMRNEAIRLASVAWTDVGALEELLLAVEEAYFTSRQSRDVLLERFRVTRGTLFDAIDAERSYFELAVVYIRTVTELDAARYVLLSATGTLLDALQINVERRASYRLNRQ
jgi:adhesin transport system outer membrane protein